MDKKLILDRIDFNEKRIRTALEDLKLLRLSVESEFPESDMIIKLINSEKFRIQTALNFCKTKKEAAEMLNISERTLFRKIIEYNIF